MASGNRNNNSVFSQMYVPPITTHDRMRDQLARDVENFLSHGGEIKHLETHVRSNIGANDIDTDSF